MSFYLNFILTMAASVVVASATAPARAEVSALELAALYAAEVQPRWQPPADVQQRYIDLTRQMLLQAQITLAEAQYVLVVDRAPAVQVSLLYWTDGGTDFRLIGAAPVSTGRIGQFDHFLTPTGVFRHSVDNPDYRALGTRNSKGVRGYGVRGMRVFDLGWQTAQRGWGKGASGTMRLQMHATDPDLLEPLLGSAQSKGCIRIPASLNRLLDIHGVLDADYQAARAAGERIMGSIPVGDVDTPGRYIVVVDSETVDRPDWASPLR